MTTQHRVTYCQAIRIIQDHGHFAAITKDGLLALSEVVAPPHGVNVFDCHVSAELADRVFLEPMLFEVDADGMVPSKPVRMWLGY
jgi:hypothetical protein